MRHLLILITILVANAFSYAHAEYPKAYVGTPFTQDAAMSPSGDFVATLTSGTDIQPLWGGDWDEVSIKSSKTGETILMHSPEDRFYHWIDWPFSDVLIANGIEYKFGRRKVEARTIVVSLNPSTGTERILAESPYQRLDKDLFFPKLTHISTDTREIVISLPSKKDTKLVKINVDTGAQSLIDRGPKKTLGWDLTAQMVPTLRIVESKSKLTHQYQIFDAEQREWKAALTLDRLGSSLWPIARQGNSSIYLVVARPPESNFAGLYNFNFSTRTFEKTVYVPDGIDLSIAAIKEDQSLLYAGYWKDGLQKHWFDTDAEHHGKLITKAFGPGVNWRIIEISDADTDWLIYASGPKRPGSYYHFSIDRKQLRPVGKRRPGIKKKDLSETTTIEYKAQDDTALMGYFTPATHINGPAPLIVMPHGGPVSRDFLDYEPWAQYFARLGYSVFLPQFRGSGGFGRDFETSGFGEWDKAMRTDIEDGVAELIDAGLVRADLPKSIIGASYGGYAALSAATTASSNYQCAVSINGVSDVVRVIEQYDQTDPYESFIRDIWIKRIGNPDTELEELKAISPLNRIQNLDAQVLLIHGKDDQIVWFEQSDEMNRAITEAGKYAKFYALENTGHNNWSDDTSTDILVYMERFIRDCMPTFQN